MMAEKEVPMTSVEADEILESLSKMEREDWEELVKKCPRCGGASANPSNPQGRCSACLKKLKSAKKTPGHWQRAQTKFDDSKRRERGKNGTAHKKSKGLAESRQKFVKKFKGDEKKTGQKLSPDRKDNAKGYASSNVRNVKESLNRGRHSVDPKKLAAWKKSLKKADLTFEEFVALLITKACDFGDPEIGEALLKAVEKL